MRVVEDGGAQGVESREGIGSIRELGGNVVGAACLVDRSAGEADVGVPLIPLLPIAAPIYAEDALPEALAAIPAEKPGSRALNPG